MNELFETVLILSLIGFLLTALLLLLKPVTIKRFPAKWQYYVWIAVLISMIVPVYKFIPEREVQRFSEIAENDIVSEYTPNQENDVSGGNAELQTNVKNDIDKTPAISIRAYFKSFITEMRNVFPVIWIFGVGVYVVFVMVFYTAYLIKRRKNSFLITDNLRFESAKKELGIKRNIKLKISNDIGSPMLVGMIFPTVYIPAKDINDENMRMVFLHELTHYKRKDLLVKWFSLFVNSVHWFNPLAYLLCANVSESCEISCDMAVTQNMSETEQKIYMKTILDLAE